MRSACTFYILHDITYISPSFTAVATIADTRHQMWAFLLCPHHFINKQIMLCSQSWKLLCTPPSMEPFEESGFSGAAEEKRLDFKLPAVFYWQQLWWVCPLGQFAWYLKFQHNVFCKHGIQKGRIMLRNFLLPLHKVGYAQVKNTSEI